MRIAPLVATPPAVAASAARRGRTPAGRMRPRPTTILREDGSTMSALRHGDGTVSEDGEARSQRVVSITIFPKCVAPRR